jgi:hypothetical protein
VAAHHPSTSPQRVVPARAPFAQPPGCNRKQPAGPDGHHSLTTSGPAHTPLWPARGPSPTRVRRVTSIRLKARDIDNGIGKCLRRFLWQIMSDAAANVPMVILAGKLLRVGCRLGMRSAVGVALHGDGRNSNGRRRRQTRLEFVVLRFALDQPQPPAVVVNHHRNVIRIVERLSRAVERCIVKIPFRRRETPDQLVEVVAVRFIPRLATLRGEIELIPPCQLSLRRQRRPVGLLTPDQITAYRHHRRASLRPQRRNDIHRARAPIEATE